MLAMNDLLELMAEKRASDLHLTAWAPPTLRIDGSIVQTPMEKLTPENVKALVRALLNDEQWAVFERDLELDLAVSIQGMGRLRLNVFQQRGLMGAVLRAIPSMYPSFQELGLPPQVAELVKLNQGLILVTGATGAGKSTTLASLIDHINTHQQAHIITVEDPIEFVHAHKRSLVNQRELGPDTRSFFEALRHVLRQDPDVILIGEMRDAETMSAALTIAETGHLVLSSMHTRDAVGSVNRILDNFPPHRQDQVRSQLSMTLQAIISQALLPHVSGGGRVLACEYLIVNAAIRNLIRENKLEQIYLSMQTGGKQGMQTLNQALTALHARRRISTETALRFSLDPEELQRALAKSGTGLKV